MVSNLVVRNKRTGYVSLVAKARVNGESRTVEYICGLGAMDQGEFKHFQKWAHSIKDQRMRRDRVLACPMVVEEKVKVEGKVATAVQKKTTVKRAPKKVKEGFSEPLKAMAIGIDKEKARREYEKKHGIPKADKPKFVSKKGVVMYKIGDLTHAQELEAEIKTLKGSKEQREQKFNAEMKSFKGSKEQREQREKGFKIEMKTLKGSKEQREKKIKSILGKKYKSCREVATAANKGDVYIDDS